MLPHNIKSAVSPTPLYCPPKNRAVTSSRAAKYAAPDRRHTIARCRFTLPLATIAPAQADRIRITSTAYPESSHFSIYPSISFAVRQAPARVIPAAHSSPQVIPAGMDTAVPVGFRFTVNPLSPFRIPYLAAHKKRTGTDLCPGKSSYLNEFLIKQPR